MTTAGNRTPHRTPDPHALNVAHAAQQAVRPDLVILFGSRAAGDHREDSDINLLVITNKEDHDSSRSAAEGAARAYISDNPPDLELSLVSTDRRTFDRCRLANQHIAAQALLYGVNMSGATLEMRSHKDDEYPDHWPETGKRIRAAKEWKHQLDRMDDQKDRNEKLLGFSTQRAVENALKGWLSTHNDTGRYDHDLAAA